MEVKAFKRINILLALLIVMIQACTPAATENSDAGSRIFNGNGGSSSSGANRARVLETNPVAQVGIDRAVQGMNMIPLLSNSYKDINYEGSTLARTCQLSFSDNVFFFSNQFNISNCFKILKTDRTDYSVSSLSFTPNQEDFYYVNTFYLFDQSFNKFKEAVGKARELGHGNSSNYLYPSSIPFASLHGYWNSTPINLLDPDELDDEFGDDLEDDFEDDDFDLEESNIGAPVSEIQTKSLSILPLCNFADNSFYDPNFFEICIGYLSDYQGVLFAQDPSVVYHEFGHVFVDVFMNARNPGASARTTLGTLFYDEAGAINEGIADYFAYAMTGREHIGEWALGKFLDADRPLSENNSLHSSAIQSGAIKLSYPEYLNYNVYDISNPTEDIHYSGQIISHFLVALTKQISSSCMSAEAARTHVLSLLAETLATLGDLTGKESDLNDSENELSPDLLGTGTAIGSANNLDLRSAFEWSQVINPPNMRKFIQTFSRSVLYRTIIGPCSGNITQDSYEQLLDQYGLLLFSTYNDDFDILVDGETSSLESGEFTIPYLFSKGDRFDFGLDFLNPIKQINRQNTILISKDQLSLPDSLDTRPQAYIFDRRSDVEGILNAMTFRGAPADISTGIAGQEYNNANGYISPGEVVGVSINVINHSNSPVAGLHVLATDWDHLKYDENGDLKPCQYDGFPLESEGGQVDEDPESPIEGDCHFTTRNNGLVEDPENPPVDQVAPICLVQIRENNETRWATQEEFRQDSGVFPWECLNSDDHKITDPDSGAVTYSPNNACFIRTLNIGKQAFYSKLNPGKSLIETLKRNDGQGVSLNASSAVFMEASKFIPPGTIFLCRFRVQHNNCSDCFEDSEQLNDEYLDYEYAGPKPFKIINFKFTVID